MFLNLFSVQSCNIQLRTTKFVLLSLIIFMGLPIPAMNLIIAFSQLSVSSFGTFSIYTALTFRHVNEQHHRFSFLRPIFILERPKQSSPIFAKALEASNHSVRSFAITRAIVCALSLGHVIHLFLMERKAFFTPTIKNRCWTVFVTCSAPSWLLSMCSLRKKSSGTWCLQCNDIEVPLCQ